MRDAPTPVIDFIVNGKHHAQRTDWPQVPSIGHFVVLGGGRLADGKIVVHVKQVVWADDEEWQRLGMPGARQHVQVIGTRRTALEVRVNAGTTPAKS
jgi:hypothetical protein